MNLKPSQEEANEEPAPKKRAIAKPVEDNVAKFAEAMDNFLPNEDSSNICDTADKLHKHFSSFSFSKKEKLLSCFKRLIALEDQQPLEDDWNKFPPGFSKPLEWNYSDILDFPSSNQFVDNLFLDRDTFN